MNARGVLQADHREPVGAVEVLQVEGLPGFAGAAQPEAELALLAADGDAAERLRLVARRVEPQVQRLDAVPSAVQRARRADDRRQVVLEAPHVAIAEASVVRDGAAALHLLHQALEVEELAEGFVFRRESFLEGADRIPDLRFGLQGGGRQDEEEDDGHPYNYTRGRRGAMPRPNRRGEPDSFPAG